MSRMAIARALLINAYQLQKVREASVANPKFISQDDFYWILALCHLLQDDTHVFDLDQMLSNSSISQLEYDAVQSLLENNLSELQEYIEADSIFSSNDL